MDEQQQEIQGEEVVVPETQFTCSEPATPGSSNLRGVEHHHLMANPQIVNLKGKIAAIVNGNELVSEKNAENYTPVLTKS